MMTDIVGQRFGRLTVSKLLEEKKYNETAYLCECDCGKETTATRSQLTGGKKKSCGCLRKESPSNVLDLTGQSFGMLTVIQRAGKTMNDNAVWLCRCECGETTKAMGTTLRRGEIVSCGCQKDVQIGNARNILMTEKTIDGVQIPLLTKKVRSDSGTGHKGIHKRTRKGREYYEAYITVKGKRYYRTSQTLEGAIAAHDALVEQYHQPYIDQLKQKEQEE